MTLHMKKVEETLSFVGSTRQGLSADEASARMARDGRNLLERAPPKTTLQRLGEQLANPMVLVLVGAAILSGIFGEWIDALIIFGVVGLNTLLGVVQEGRSERSIEALARLTADTCRVLRDGAVREVPAEELVVGDLVELDPGEYVAADMRLIEAASLKIEEAALTGESAPVEKQTAALDDASLPLGDRTNLAFMGSTVTYGRGVGVVVATGMRTEMGRIATALNEPVQETTPLQAKIAQLSKLLSLLVLGICAALIVVGLVRGDEGSFFELFMMAVSLAVAAIPEGLPAVITVVLALGVTRMAKRKALIRKLHAVETLGCTQVICSDKTGTLTQNRMTVQALFIEGKEYAVDQLPATEAAARAGQVFLLCNDAKGALDDDTSGPTGDPTEVALLTFAARRQTTKAAQEALTPRVGEAPFDSERKRMSTLHALPSGYAIYAKGAPDELLRCCTHYLAEGEVRPLDAEGRAQIEAANKRFADRAMRVLGAAYRECAERPAEQRPEAFEHSMIFAGMVAMIDPPRPEAKLAIAECRAAGIRPVMITGDHRDTAVAIASQLGIMDAESKSMTGSEIERLSQEELTRIVDRCAVYARVAPEHKVRIVKAWQANGKVVAMTGDGVNDAPALKAADIGVGMGITGTDVSKSVSEMVLADDNFATIVSAVREGRKVYANLKKVVQFLLSTNASEVLALFVATLFGIKLLYPIHILWVNLVSDTFPALGLGVEPAEKGIMRERPRASTEGFFAGGMVVDILYQGLALAGLTLLAYRMGAAHSPKVGTTMAFVVLSSAQLFHAFNLRARRHSILRRGGRPNLLLLGASAVSLALTVAIVSIEGLNTLFRVEALSLREWGVALALSAAIIPIVELVKAMQRSVAALRREEARGAPPDEEE